MSSASIQNAVDSVDAPDMKPINAGPIRMPAYPVVVTEAIAIPGGIKF